ncbi:chloroplastic import inner membrane translocase subunit HP30-2-like [Wolffia australiana]
MGGGGKALARRDEQREAAGAAFSPPFALLSTASPLAAAQKWITEKQERFQAWMALQPVPVEAAITAGLGAIQGGVLGGLISTLSKDLQSEAAKSGAPGMDTGPPNPFLQPEGMAGGPLAQARNFAVLTGVNAGISTAMKRIRGVDDIQNSMAAAFGSGFTFSLVSSPGGPNVASALGTGAFFALIQGGFYKLGEMMPKGASSSEDIYYNQGRSMLLRLGLDRYEKNFRKGMLTDATLPLLTDSALQDVGIPPGPRLVILDHVRRDPELSKARR